MTTATVTWPTTLPASPEIQYSESYKDNVIRSEMDAGIQKTRQRYTRQQRMLQLSYVLTNTQKTAFSSFFNSIKGGALPFNMIDPVAGTSIVVRLTGPVNGPAYVTKNLWRVQFEVEVLP